MHALVYFVLQAGFRRGHLEEMQVGGNRMFPLRFVALEFGIFLRFTNLSILLFLVLLSLRVINQPVNFRGI